MSFCDVITCIRALILALLLLHGFVFLNLFQKYSMNFDKSTGIIEMFMDSLEVTDEGTFTFNLVDGKAKGTTSLVLIGDGKRPQTHSLPPC